MQFKCGDKRARTADICRARTALYQLSYTPCTYDESDTSTKVWAVVDLNHRPYAYQAYALTNCANSPIHYTCHHSLNDTVILHTGTLGTWSDVPHSIQYYTGWAQTSSTTNSSLTKGAVGPTKDSPIMAGYVRTQALFRNQA